VTIYLFIEPLRYPGSDWVVAACQEPGVVGVQALDPSAGPAHATVWPGTDVIGRQLGVALGGVAGMRIGNERGVNL
jgi:hypothetical protein